MLWIIRRISFVCAVGALVLVCVAGQTGVSWAEDAALAAEPAEDPETLQFLDILTQVGQARGKVVLVNFWATWCTPCLQEIPELKETRSNYSADELVLMGVSVDDNREDLTAFLEKNTFNYPIYFAHANVGPAFQLQNIPRILVYDKNGVLAFSHTGYLGQAELRKVLDQLIEG